MPQGGRKPQGRAGGVAVVVEVVMALRQTRKAGECVYGTGGQGAGSDALASATGRIAKCPCYAFCLWLKGLFARLEPSESRSDELLCTLGRQLHGSRAAANE